MIDPKLLEGFSEPIINAYSGCVDRLLVNIASHFKGAVSDYDFEWSVKKLAEQGGLTRENIDIIKNSLKNVNKETFDILERAMLKSVEETDAIYAEAIKSGFQGRTMHTGISNNMQNMLNAYRRQAVDQMNLVNTTMLDSALAGYKKVIAQTIMNESALEVASGSFSRQQALSQAIRQLANEGITGFRDKSGRNWSPEAYVNMDLRTTTNNIARESTTMRNEEYGNDLVSIPVLAAARPLCYPWQGKVISTTDNPRTVEDLDGNKIRVYAQSETSYGEPAGLWGINCHHNPDIFIAGYSIVRYEQRDKEKNDKEYEISQQQRLLERDVRKDARTSAMFKAQGNEEEAKKYFDRSKEKENMYNDFCAEQKVTPRKDRLKVYGI